MSPAEQEALRHRMNCPHRSMAPEDDCTCALKERIALQSTETVLAAWQKRAAEAEQELGKLHDELEKAKKAHRTARNDALEEAARIAEQPPETLFVAGVERDHVPTIAEKVRALKTKEPK